MSHFSIERSSKDPALFYLRRLAPNGIWSSKLALRAPHDLTQVLRGEGFDEAAIAAVDSMGMGTQMIVDTN